MYSQDTVRAENLVIELPIADIPYQFDASKTTGNFFEGYANPSMHQSLSLTTDLYTCTHYGIARLFKSENSKSWGFGKRFLYFLTIGTANYITTCAPGFDGWLHEEYHRAVLSRFHVNSFNDMNKFPIGAELINVSHVKDEDLVRFKLQSPIDLTRSHVAGIEGEYLLIDKLQRNNFYYEQNLPHEFLYLTTTLNSVLYVMTCRMPETADKMTDDASKKETEISSRDYTGLDFLAWTYDMFRPEEPYTTRGTHVSGNGIDRYIKTTDLTKEELDYLKRQGNLQWLNLISPMNFSIRRIKLPWKGYYGNFAVRDILTPFGNDISTNFYLVSPANKYFFALHCYNNFKNTFAAIEAQMIDVEKPILGKLFYISPRIIAGVQPLRQQFKTSEAAFMAMAECKLEMKTKSLFHPFLEVSAKTKGWVAGDEFLGDNFSCRAGVVMRFKD